MASRHRRQPDAWRRNLEHELEAKSRGHYRGNKSEYALFGEPSFSGPLAPSNIKKVAAPVLGGRKVGVMQRFGYQGPVVSFGSKELNAELPMRTTMT